MRITTLYQRSSSKCQQGSLFCCTCSPGVLPRLRIASLATAVLAVNDLGLCRMHLQTAFGQTKLKLGHDDLRLLLAPAMHQSVVCIPTPRKLRVCPCHPQIERIMQEQICQYGTDNPALRCTAGSLNLRAILHAHRRGQPSFDVEDRPWARHVLPNRPQQKRVIDVVERELQLIPLSRTRRLGM